MSQKMLDHFMTRAVIMASLAGLIAAQSDWTLYKLTSAAASSGAVCLDGSPAAYYLRAPLNKSSTNRFLVFMEGGGWCYQDDNCLERSDTDLGSSKNYPSKISGEEDTGLFDLFATSTIIYVKYCDGSSFTGDVEAPRTVTNVTGTYKIYYRGKRIFDALFHELFTEHGLTKADELLFAGCSAGALTTYTHADYVTDLMKTSAPQAKVLALADAMFSLHHNGYPANPNNYYTGQFVWGFTAWNSSGAVDASCLASFPESDRWMCFHGAIAAKFVTTPLLVVNSKYDTWQERGVLGLNTTNCPGNITDNGTVILCSGPGNTIASEEAFWLSYGQEMISAVDTVAHYHGAFLTNCPCHCQGAGSAWVHPAFPGTRLDAAVAQWYCEAIDQFTGPGQSFNLSWKAPRWIAQQGEECAKPKYPFPYNLTC